MNLTVLATYFITGIVVEYLVGVDENIIRKGVKLGQITISSFVFGFITPSDYNEVASFYIITPAVLRLLGFRVGDMIERYVAGVIGRMFLNGKTEIDFRTFWQHVLQECASGKQAGKRDREPDEAKSGKTYRGI